MARKRNKPVDTEIDRSKVMTIREYSRETGISEPAIRGRIAAGLYREDEHYYRKGKGKNCRIELIVDACAKLGW